MRVALFGGTFDPVHRGHLTVARAAVKKFDLDKVYFAPADIPPHKQKRSLADFHHRFAMLALATAGEPRFVPSLIDAPSGQPNYSYETVLRLKRSLRKSDQFYFLIGIDAFTEIATWYKPVELLGECDFIVVSRPGHSLGDIARSLPPPLRPRALRNLNGKQGAIALSSSTIHLLTGVNEPASSTLIRTYARKSVSKLRRYVPGDVADYIRKQHLYQSPSAVRRAHGRGHGKILSSNHEHQRGL